MLDRGAPHGRGDRRPRRAVPGPRQPHDRPRPGRSPRGGRRRSPTSGIDAAKDAGLEAGLRQHPARQRRRLAVPPRALGGGAGDEHDRARVAPGRRQLPERARVARDRRDRAVGGRGGAVGCSARRCSSSRPSATPSRRSRSTSAAASFALWRGDLADARRAAERGWALVRETEDWILAARTAATAIEVDAAAAAEARERRDLAVLATARERARRGRPSRRGDRRATWRRPSIGSRRSPMRGWRRPVRYRRRVDGRDDARVGRRSATGGRRSTSPTRSHAARWREAEAMLGSGRRASRPRRCAPAARGGRDRAASLGALPLLRELRELAGRALITVPGGRRARSPARPIDRASSVGVGRAMAAQRRPAPSGAEGGAPSWSRRCRRGQAGPRRHVRTERREREVLVQIAARPDQPRDRRAAVHQPEDRRRPRRQHPGQARRVGPGRGRRGRDPPRPDRGWPDAADAPPLEARDETRREVSGSRMRTSPPATSGERIEVGGRGPCRRLAPSTSGGRRRASGHRDDRSE